MIVMPANATGWFWHCLVRETGRLGHLYSPRAQRGPWPWFPYACDNGAFACWEPKTNTFDEVKWGRTEQAWRELLMWCECAPMKPRWAIVPDVPGNSPATLSRWPGYVGQVLAAGISPALAVQDGMTPADVLALDVQPSVICVGGTTEWKWSMVETWARAFPRVHVLRVNAPDKLDYLERLGIESCDGTGWNRGDKKQTAGLERWARKAPCPTSENLTPFVCKQTTKNQLCFA